VARRAQFSNKGRIHLRGPPCQLHFSLAEERRTIHLLRRLQTLEQLAERFSVSAPWAWKISAQRKRTGQMERVEQRRGTVRKVTAEVEQRLRGWVQAQPDLTLAELQQKLAKAQHLQVSIGRLWQVLRKMGLRLKKSHSTPANATRKPTSGGAKPSSRRSAGSRRSG
jgi:transposase